MGNSILDYEAKVKEIYAQDRTSPELYTALLKLAEKILVIKRMVRTRSEVEEISHNLASDFYCRIASGELEIVCWTKYIQLMLKTYRNHYYDSNKKCQIVIEDAVVLEDFRDTIYSSSKFSMSKESSLETEDYINYLPLFILEQYDKVVRYRKNTREYTDILISVLCSIIQKKTVIINSRVEDERDYVELLVKILMKRLNNYTEKTCVNKNEIHMYDLIDACNSF